MKRISIIVSFVLLIAGACKDTKVKEEKKGEEIPVKIEKKETKRPKLTLEERKKLGEAVRADLAKFKLAIPDTLVFFNSVIDANAFKKSTFRVDNVDEKLRKVLDTWYAKQIKDLEKNKWDKTQIQKEEKVSELLINSYSFKKPQGGQSTLYDVISLTSVYDASRQTYQVYIKPYILEN
jgi:multidrug efflux pump subunit AcrB